MDTRKRLAALRGILAEERVDALLVSGVHNVRYLSGFTGDDSLALVGPDRCRLITDFRYVEQAEQECPGWTIVERKKDLWSAVGRVVGKRCAKVGFESQNLTFRNHKLLRSALKKARLVPLYGKVENLREVKDADEVSAIEASIRTQEQAFQDLQEWVRPGMTERRIARELEYRMGCDGADKPAFDTIVAAGSRGSLPHAHASERVVRKGDALLIDWGARRFFYNSDLTRVLHFGRVSAKFERIDRIVKDAQSQALAVVRPGIQFGEVDAAARDHISSKGFGARFGHSLGHGVGLEVHELPQVRKRNEERLQPGMVFTIEPGIYIPGWGGVRIEDMVLVTQTGVRVLSSCESDLGRMIL
jgi:Xaa-Pro aminopeptidase/Xaa-Pro dipeptidase